MAKKLMQKICLTKGNKDISVKTADAIIWEVNEDIQT